MNRKTAVTILLCFVCAAVIGVCAMAGVSKWKEHQAELERRQQLEQYSAQLEDAFDALYEMETGLLSRMAEQQQAGGSNREILVDAIEAIRAPMDALAAVDAPDGLSEVQRHFSEAAASFGSMADTVTGLLADETQDGEALRSAAVMLLPDAVDAFDQLRYGVEALEESGAPVPDSAQKLMEELDALLDSGVSSMLTGQD
ncbi:hypothetical protein [Butyricicoccus sp.]|uniref:hypothetical protein n=1 Tax=Butyricicoccus sp. TaxID=2049021 RepID=UPI003735302D